jgi:hypothetical protein
MAKTKRITRHEALEALRADHRTRIEALAAKLRLKFRAGKALTERIDFRREGRKAERRRGAIIEKIEAECRAATEEEARLAIFLSPFHANVDEGHDWTDAPSAPGAAATALDVAALLGVDGAWYVDFWTDPADQGAGVAAGAVAHALPRWRAW